eukprot:COSAG03_NODE_605_length_6748_cov_9.478869_2_plen_95_part_00
MGVLQPTDWATVSLFNHSDKQRERERERERQSHIEREGGRERETETDREQTQGKRSDRQHAHRGATEGLRGLPHRSNMPPKVRRPLCLWLSQSI